VPDLFSSLVRDRAIKAVHAKGEWSGSKRGRQVRLYRIDRVVLWLVGRKRWETGSVIDAFHAIEAVEEHLCRTK
jgi:hypothetical protein